MGIYIPNLIIEVTRRCNMACEHCLRGDAQDIDLDISYVDALFKQIDQIGSIVFTGGEPSLVPGIITQIRESLIKHGVEFSSFYCVTNGLNNSAEFTMEMLNWYLMAEDKESSQVDVSLDYFHQLEGNVKKDGLYLSALSFFGTREQGDYNEGKSLLNEGRAAENFLVDRSPQKPDDIHVLVDDYELGIENEVYLNCNGELINGCDWSYESQPNYMICRVFDNLEHTLLDLMETV